MLDCQRQPYAICWHIRLAGRMKSYQVGALDVFGRDICSWRHSRGTRCARSSGRPMRHRHRSGHGVLADLLMPAMQAAFEANARSLAVSRALRIDNALRQFAEKNGREAKGLEELDLPKEATIDPYSGEPLKLKHTEDGWIMYSVMQNGVDDGGDFKELKDYGVAPRESRDGKVGATVGRQRVATDQ